MSDPRLDRATSRIFKDRYVIFLKSCLMRCWAMLIDMVKGDALANIACCWPLMVSMALCTSGCVVVLFICQHVKPQQLPTPCSLAIKFFSLSWWDAWVELYVLLEQIHCWLCYIYTNISCTALWVCEEAKQGFRVVKYRRARSSQEVVSL